MKFLILNLFLTLLLVGCGSSSDFGTSTTQGQSNDDFVIIDDSQNLDPTVSTNVVDPNDYKSIDENGNSVSVSSTKDTVVIINQPVLDDITNIVDPQNIPSPELSSNNEPLDTEDLIHFCENQIDSENIEEPIHIVVTSPESLNINKIIEEIFDKLNVTESGLVNLQDLLSNLEIFTQGENPDSIINLASKVFTNQDISTDQLKIDLNIPEILENIGVNGEAQDSILKIGTDLLSSISGNSKDKSTDNNVGLGGIFSKVFNTFFNGFKERSGKDIYNKRADGRRNKVIAAGIPKIDKKPNKTASKIKPIISKHRKDVLRAELSYIFDSNEDAILSLEESHIMKQALTLCKVEKRLNKASRAKDCVRKGEGRLKDRIDNRLEKLVSKILSNDLDNDGKISQQEVSEQEFSCL